MPFSLRGEHPNCAVPDCPGGAEEKKEVRARMSFSSVLGNLNPDC